MAEAFVYTDPACPWSWAAEPALRRLQADFGTSLEICFVMGGLAREFKRPLETMRHWIDAGDASGMPVDPRLWLDAPPRPSYPPLPGAPAVLPRPPAPLVVPRLPGGQGGGRAGPRRALSPPRAGGTRLRAPQPRQPRAAGRARAHGAGARRRALPRRPGLQRDRRGLRRRP